MSKRTVYPFLQCLHMLWKGKSCSKLEALSSLRQLSSSQRRHGNIMYGAICVERHPVVTPTKSKIEQQFSELLTTIEHENSYLSDHEVRHLKEQQAAKNKQENTEEEATNADAETVTALDLEDRWDAEVKQFSPASRITAADEQGYQRSLERKLDESLYLLVKQDVAGRDHWVLPQATWEQGETLRETAERALTNVSGGVQATVLGNAPCAVAKYDPPSESEEQGIKLFFYKAWYREGDVDTQQGSASDYAWVTREEMKELCHNSYRKHLKKFIFDF